MTLSALQQLHASFPGSQVTLSMNDPASHNGPEPVVGAFMTWTQTLTGDRRGRWQPLALARLLAASLGGKWPRPRFRLAPPAARPLLQAFQAADLVVSAPGNCLYSSGKLSLPLLHHLYTLWYAQWLGKPVYIFPQSIGPFRHDWEAALTRAVLRRARIVMVREQVSLDKLAAQGFEHPRLALLPDLAFAFQGAAPEAAQAWLGRMGVDLAAGRPRLGLTALNWAVQNPQFTRQSEYEQALAEAAAGFIQHTGGQAVLFAQVCGPSLAADDRVPARRVAERLRALGPQVVQIDEPASPELLRTAYSFMDLFVGTRMHSNIFALAGGVPALAVAYRHKTRGLMETMSLADWVLEIEKVTGVELRERVLALWAVRAELRPLIQARAAALAAEARRAGEWAAEDYAAWQASRA